MAAGVVRDILKRVAKEKPRIFQDSRDISINVVVIVVLMLLAVGFTGMCSFNPGRPENGPVQEVDGQTFLSMESRAVDFAVRYPDVPEGWVNNSARRTTLNGTPAPVMGWVTPHEGFLQVTQTGVDEDTALKGIDASPRSLARTEDVAGHEAKVYSSDDRDVRDVWFVDLGDERILITGAAEATEFRELIEMFAAAQPLAK